MRYYIFTDLERKLIEAWLHGKPRTSNLALDHVLTRIRQAYPNLAQDFKLLMHAYVKIKVTKATPHES